MTNIFIWDDIENKLVTCYLIDSYDSYKGKTLEEIADKVFMQDLLMEESNYNTQQAKVNLNLDIKEIIDKAKIETENLRDGLSATKKITNIRGNRETEKTKLRDKEKFTFEGKQESYDNNLDNTEIAKIINFNREMEDVKPTSNYVVFNNEFSQDGIKKSRIMDLIKKMEE